MTQVSVDTAVSAAEAVSAEPVVLVAAVFLVLAANPGQVVSPVSLDTAAVALQVLVESPDLAADLVSAALVDILASQDLAASPDLADDLASAVFLDLVDQVSPGFLDPAPAGLVVSQE